MNKNTEIQITYCVECGFLSMASSLAEDISKRFGLEAKLIEEGVLVTAGEDVGAGK